MGVLSLLCSRFTPGLSPMCRKPPACADCMFGDRSGRVCVCVDRKWLACVVNVKPSLLLLWCLCVHVVVVTALCDGLCVDRVIRIPWWYHGGRATRGNQGTLNLSLQHNPLNERIQAPSHALSLRPLGVCVSVYVYVFFLLLNTHAPMLTSVKRVRWKSTDDKQMFKSVNIFCLCMGVFLCRLCSLCSESARSGLCCYGLWRQLREYLRLAHPRQWRKGFACPQAAVEVAR